MSSDGRGDYYEDQMGNRHPCNFCLSDDNAKGKSSGSNASDDPEAYYQNNTFRYGEGGAERLSEAGTYAAKEAGLMLLGGALGKGLARVAMFMRVGKLARLSRAASVEDRNGLTKAGRALQKHGGRPGSLYPNVGHKSANETGQNLVNEILQASGGQGRQNRYGGLDYLAPDGRGVRFNDVEEFMGFLEP